MALHLGSAGSDEHDANDLIVERERDRSGVWQRRKSTDEDENAPTRCSTCP